MLFRSPSRRSRRTASGSRSLGSPYPPPPGDVVSLRTPGGGGYGDPADRDPEAVRRDLRLGKLSAEAAREVYGYEE